MHRFAGWLVAILVMSEAACGGQTAQQKADTPVDTVVAEPAPPPEPQSEASHVPPTNIEVPGSGEEYVLRGVCPYECCKYGNWTMFSGGALRSEPSLSADSVGAVAAGAAVRTDEGAMVLHPPGIAVVVPDTSTHGSSGPAVGDTVEVITYTGAKVSRVRWQGQELEMSWNALQMVREPLQRWWVHMTDPATGQEGWMQMGGVVSQDVGGRNSCNSKK